MHGKIGWESTNRPAGESREGRKVTGRPPPFPPKSPGSIDSLDRGDGMGAKEGEMGFRLKAEVNGWNRSAETPSTYGPTFIWATETSRAFESFTRKSVR